MMSYSQPQEVPSQGKELLPQLQQQAPSANVTTSPSPRLQQQQPQLQQDEEPCDGVYFGPGKCM
jgi:hypothetical protein